MKLLIMKNTSTEQKFNYSQLATEIDICRGCDSRFGSGGSNNVG